MQKFNNSVAVVTGAGSGIGQQLAYQLGDAGAKLGIADNNSDTLEQTLQELERRGVKTLAVTLDVSDRAAVFDFAGQVQQQFGHANLVVNNAGVALGSGSLLTTSIEDFEWLMGINFSGVLYGTKAFLPIMELAEWGHVVNISSLFGLVSVASQSAYNASKFAVRGMTDALRQELKLLDSHISCTCVHPGGIKTNIARSARWIDLGDGNAEQQRDELADNFDKLARTTAESAAQQILKAVIKDKPRLLIGMDAKLIDKLQRLFPTGYSKIMSKLMGDAERRIINPNS
ncbi:MAG: SDR family oxidoreductase [Gammaproteobacteria bacterium]|nr:SDR family oxidoreductase [Gammaproteobacteria bacterium]